MATMIPEIYELQSSSTDLIEGEIQWLEGRIRTIDAVIEVYESERQTLLDQVKFLKGKVKQP